jgi:hypothetical protein
MSETEKFVGKIKLQARLDNESDKEYFERITGHNWQVYEYVPDSIQEAIYDNNISYFEAKHGNKGYIVIDKCIYEIIELHQRDIEESYCIIEQESEDTYKFEAQYYNGGCSLAEMIQDGFKEIKNAI